MTKRIFTAALAAFYLLLCACGAGDKGMDISIAYVVDPHRSTDGNAVVYEHQVIAPLEGEELYRAVLEAALKPPVSQMLVSPYPDGLRVLGVEKSSDGIVTVDMSGEYTSLPGASLALADYCTVLTLGMFPEVEGVIILSEGQPLAGHEAGKILRKTDVVLHAAALRALERELTLYFPDAEGAALVAQRRTVLIFDEDAAPLAAARALIEGMQDGDGNFLPFAAEGAAVNSADMREDICYIDVNPEYLAEPHFNSNHDSLTIYAMVQTLCALPGVSRVQFLVDGQMIKSFVHEAFDAPIEPLHAVSAQ